MKKLIGTASFVLVMGCALALANAADNDTADKMKSESTTTTTTDKTASAKKSCTNDNGKVIKPGHTGYNDCVKHAKEQMGGTADESIKKSEKSVDKTLNSGAGGDSSN
jgi:hypothetical protein